MCRKSMGYQKTLKPGIIGGIGLMEIMRWLAATSMFAKITT